MATPPLPAAYVERMTSLLGDEAADFFASYQQPARPGLRVNTRKITPEEFQQRSPWPLEPVPWCPTGFYLPEDAPAGKHPWHAAGVYYLQEPSAMAVVEQMRFPTSSAWVADICAAPGGKATQIEERLGAPSLLVANDVVGSRIKPLGENLERWGADQAVITNLEISRLGTFLPGQFDAVLVDAPCSGEGLFRRTPDARTEWSPMHVEGSARRQRTILEAASRLVMPGGDLVYSTCTFAPEENEQIVAGFLDAHPRWALVPIEGIDGATPGYSNWAGTSHNLGGMARLWPHRVEGDGHTIARLSRPRDAESELSTDRWEPFAPLSASSAQRLDAFTDAFTPGFANDGIAIQQRDAVFFVPTLGELLGDVPMVRNGLWMGNVAPDRFTPSHALALSLELDDCTLVEVLDFEEAARYLSGETLKKPGAPGWVLMGFDGFPLGWGKRSGDVIKNHYPKGLRRPVASWMSATG